MHIKWQTEKHYLAQLLEEAKSAHREEMGRVEAHMERLRDRERELVVLLSKAQVGTGGQMPQAPHQQQAAAAAGPVLTASMRMQREELERQVFLAEQQKRQLAQELADAALRLERGRLEAAEAARGHAALQEEVYGLRERVRRLQGEVESQMEAGADAEALRARLRGREAQLAAGRREGQRFVEALQARVRALERLALSVSALSASVEGARLRDAVRFEAAALAREVLAFVAATTTGAGAEEDGAAGSSSSSAPGSPLRPSSALHHHSPQLFFPGSVGSPVAGVGSAAGLGFGVGLGGSPQQPQVVMLDPLLSGAAQGVNESLRQENEQLKGTYVG
jgi:hypothetical protein